VSIKLFAMTCGWLTGELGRLMEGGEGEAELPIPSYLIEHPRGTALFDTGLHPACQHDPASRVGPRLSTLFRFNYHPGEEISARLAALGRDPAQIDLIITSHLHFDHVGGNALIPNATVIVQRREWEAGMDPDIAAQRGFDRPTTTSGIRSSRSTANTMYSATGRSCACRPTVTPQATSR
jgi:N-acyl homoserine lactone hydrolase